MLNFNSRKILCTALIQCHFDYSCSSWFSGVNKTLRKKLQIMQNKMVRFTLNLRRRDSVRNKEFLKVDALNVSDRMKQLKMNHVLKSETRLAHHICYLTLIDLMLTTTE